MGSQQPKVPIRKRNQKYTHISGLIITFQCMSFNQIHFTFTLYYSKTCVKRPLKNRQTEVFMTNGSLMKVECIAECSFWSILQYFSPALKVHLRHLAVNFLPQYFITLLFSLTCVLTISRRKRPKSGPKTRFQSDFYTLLIICVPPTILRQVLRYFPTVVAIHMNSIVTSYDPCADAIE